MSSIALDTVLTNASPSADLDLSLLDGADREQWMDFTVVNPDVPLVVLERELQEGSGFVPFVKSPLDLSQISFDASHGGVGLNDLSRFGKIRYILSGATNGSTVRLVIGS